MYMKYLYMLKAIYIIVQLWEAILSNAPSMVPQLLAYFPCLVEVIERSFDHLQVRLLQIDHLIFCCICLLSES